VVGLHQEVLRTDVSGMPLEWINYQEAVKLYHDQRVAYTCGSPLYKVHGGVNSISQQRSIIEVNSIIATHGTHRARHRNSADYAPPLNNATLFRRDQQICLYCGERFRNSELSRDHVTPISGGGTDTWNNVVTACRRCNNHKADRSPENANMPLLAVPFTPTHAEYIFLKGRRILADQMEFLSAHFPRTSPLHQRLNAANATGEITEETA
jgi:5-methylcytosine-specific restriction endonuclease McrA